MYTGTIFNWHDNSAFNVVPDVVDTNDRPLFMVVNSFDKGPEKLMEVDANTFYNLFGTPTFAKHGQGAIQARNIIDAGGRLLVKRVCASDSKIANSLLVANVKAAQIQKVDDEGIPIYLDPDNNETYDPTHYDSEQGKDVPNEPCNISGATISWSVESVDTAKNFNDVRKSAKDLLTTSSFPLFAISDNGRGLSNKAIRIIPDYDTSRGLEQMIYRFNVYQGTALIESMNISLDPDYKFDNEYYGLDQSRNIQISGEVIPEIFEAYVEKLVSLIYPDHEGDDKAKDIADLRKQDLIYAYGYNGAAHYGIAPETETNPETGEVTLVGTDLSVNYGVEFGFKGDYGKYGDHPATNTNTIPGSDETVFELWANDIANIYKGIDTDGSNIDEVWDVDTHKLFAVMDANYPIVVKDAMAEFVIFRKDCVMFRDLGIGYDTLASIKSRYNDVVTKYKYRDGHKFASVNSNFIADYFTTYEIEDPDSMKNIRVTMLYDLAASLVDMYVTTGPFVPLAGTYNGFVLPSAIPGTVNFTPIITPSVNQKEAIDNLRINYAIFEAENTCVVQSTYSSQKANTQLSWINNTIAIQEVARQVRIECPKNRFQLITNNDLTEYAASVRSVLDGYNEYFDILEFQYTQDPLKITQKIFYASINFGFKNWAQTEVFDLFAVSNLSTTNNTAITTEV